MGWSPHLAPCYFTHRPRMQQENLPSWLPRYVQAHQLLMTAAVRSCRFSPSRTARWQQKYDLVLLVKTDGIEPVDPVEAFF